MLTRALSRAGRLGLAAAVIVAVAAVVVAPAPATAAGVVCTPPAERTVSADGKSYTCSTSSTTTSGSDQSSNSGAPAAPSCDLDAADDLVAEYAVDNPSAPYCSGENTCILIDHTKGWSDPVADKPSEDAEMKVRWCRYPNGGTGGSPVWEGEEEPSLLEQARTAVGQIELPAPQLSTSPVNRTLVNLDTWFWVDGQPQGATGSSAFGLVAIATFGSLQIDPGDGSGAMTCPLTTNEVDAERDCTHEYDSSSRGASASVEGRPAFPVTATITYDLRFEVGGQPVEIDGAPATLGGPAGEIALRVDEVQSTVTGLR